MSPPHPHNRLQIHLSTALVLTLVAGLLLYLELAPYRHGFHHTIIDNWTQNFEEDVTWGWPYMYKYVRDGALYPMSQEIMRTELIWDVAIAAGLLLALAIGMENLTRNRARRRADTRWSLHPATTALAVLTLAVLLFANVRLYRGSTIEIDAKQVPSTTVYDAENRLPPDYRTYCRGWPRPFYAHWFKAQNDTGIFCVPLLTDVALALVIAGSMIAGSEFVIRRRNRSILMTDSAAHREVEIARSKP